jgi:hypothetical protein
MSYSIYTVPISRVKTAYAFYFPEGHWFDPASCRFFKTRLPRSAKMLVPSEAGEAVYMFISRETNPSGVTAYSVRRIDCNARRVESVGRGFHAYASREAAAADMALIIGMMNKPA